MGNLALVHPDPSFDRAKVEAKKLLCRAAIGEHPPTPSELEAFATAHPASQGPFAGRKGKLAVDLIEAVRDDHLARPSLADGRWPTFAGSPTRSRVAAGSIDVGSLQWKVDLEPIKPQPRSGRNWANRNMGMAGMGGQGIQPPPERLLAYHPIVVGDQVLIENERQVIAYNLNTRPGDREPPASTTGPVEPAWKTPDLTDGADATKVTSGLNRFTLTAYGDRVYARLGQPPSTTTPMNRGGMGMPPPSPSYVVGLDRLGGKLLWRRKASDIPLPKRQTGGGIGSTNAVFEGTPVADARHVYVAITDRIEMTATYIACLDAEFGATLWVRYICEANANVDMFGNGGFEISHRLVTLDGPTLYYQTNLGAVASLDAETGSIRWLATYPWQGRNGLGPGRDRDLNPAIIHDGLVIVSPDDTKQIFAFEAATGRMVWKTEEIAEEVKLTHMLGVAKGMLIATGDQVLWFDVKTGKKVHAWPDNAMGTQGFGRGILAGDRIYWPTRTEIHVLDQESGLKADAPIKLQESFQCEGGGNLAVGDGYLIVAQASSLVVFCQNSRLIDRYRDEIARAPEQAANYYRLAQAAEAIGRDDLALSSLETALPRAKASERIDGSPLVEAIRDHQRLLLMKLGLKAKAMKDWAESARRFALAAEVARNDRDRLSALLELSDVQLAQGDSRASVGTLQGLLSDERVRSLTIDAADGHRSVRADLLIADRISGLLREKGRSLYADFDRAAADLLARGKLERDPRLLEDVGRSYPVAKVVPAALLELGSLYEELRRPGDAARVYKRLVILAGDDQTRADALWGLARSYEAQRLWVSARDCYLQASQRFGEVSIASKGNDQSRPLAALVAERLAREPFDRMAGDGAEPVVPVPLKRRWERRWAETSRPLGAEGIPPSAEAGRVFLARGQEIRPVDPTTGESSWTRDLKAEPVWVGYLADRIIAASRTGLAALSLDKGQVEWRYDLVSAPLAGAVANPFAKEQAVDGPGENPGSLFDFRIVGNRILCLRGHMAKAVFGADPEFMVQSVMAFDGDTGLVDWSYTPTSGKINRHLLIGPRRIVLQVLKPNLVLVLDTATGRRLGEFPQGEAEEWPRDPLPLDEEHVALVVNRTKVAKFDTTKGSYAWEFEESKESPRLGAPRLFCDSERLLVLHEGQTLMRLDPATGSKMWKNWRLVGNENLSERPDAMALAPDRVFVANGKSLTSFAITDGSVIWKRPLTGPDGGWDVFLTERSVVTFPRPPKFNDESLGVLPVVFHRRSDGEPIQRLLFQATVSQLAIKFSSRGALVATQGGGWAISDRQVMDGKR
jgi:outer membrane protein assembly factor BamB/tetratricopeptide (TPR) repeat protein